MAKPRQNASDCYVTADSGERESPGGKNGVLVLSNSGLAPEAPGAAGPYSGAAGT